MRYRVMAVKTSLSILLLSLQPEPRVSKWLSRIEATFFAQNPDFIADRSKPNAWCLLSREVSAWWHVVS